MVTKERCLALADAVQRLADAAKLDDVIEVVRKTARAISGALGVTFVLRDGERCHYVEENAVGPLWKGRRFPLTACISGWCMLHRQAAVIADIYLDPRIPHDAYRPTFVKSLIMTPVGAPAPLAAIGAYWDHSREFQDGETDLLQALARSTAAAIAAIRARDELRESDERLQHALDAAKLGAWELDVAAGALAASPLCRANFGWEDAGAASIERLASTVHPDDRRRLTTAFAAAQAGRAEVGLELRVPCGDGVRWIELRGRPQHDVNGDVVRLAGVCADVTERRLAQQRIGGLQDELARVGRAIELEHTSAALAHELRQPLTAAKTYLGSALLLPADAPEQRELVGRADAELNRVNQIIRRIRSFIGAAEAERRAEDVADLLREALEIAASGPLAKDVDLRLEVPEGLPPIEVDRVQIQQVVLNLTRNAFEAVAAQQRKAVRVSARLRAEAAVEVRVEDSGPGLSREVAARLFQPFVTSKSDGMGVGLSLCKQLVERHGGVLRGENTDAGAAFWFTAPCASPSGASA